MRKLNATSILLLILTAGLLIAAYSRTGVIETQRVEMELDPINAFRSGDEWADELRIPNAALTVFRSLAIDYLWIRADNLKNEGQYFDALHLARLICALQPNLPSVWKFNAWNMAYNISVGLPTYPERWNWVRAGFELLRDEALVYNKKDQELYRELGWIFQHKIGGITDDAHRYYKIRLAYEMMPLVGTGSNEEIAALAASPHRWNVPGTSAFAEEDLLDATALVDRIQAQADPVSTFLWNVLRPDTRKLIEARDPKLPAPSLKLTLDLICDLNRALVSEELYTPERFAGVKFSDELTAVVAQNPQGWDVIRLNRLLLEAAYPELIAVHTPYRINQDEDVAAVIELVRRTVPDLAQAAAPEVIAYLRAALLIPEDHQELSQALADYPDRPAVRKLSLFLRADELRRHWKLEPVLLMAVNRMYGPVDYSEPERRLGLDWRLPWSHSIYWAVRGLEYERGKTKFDQLNLWRMVYHSLQDLYHNGYMQIFAERPPQATATSDAGGEILTQQFAPQIRLFNSQDLRMFPVAYQITLDILDAWKESGQKEPGGVVAGSVNLARNGIVSLYLAEHRDLARLYYRDLQERKPDDPSFKKSLREFVRSEMAVEVEQIAPKGASNYINGLLRSSWGHYAMVDDDNAALQENRARQIHALFKKEFTEKNERVILPEFAQMRWLSLRNMFMDPMVSVGVKDALLGRLRRENETLYDRVVAELEKELGGKDDDVTQD